MADKNNNKNNAPKKQDGKSTAMRIVMLIFARIMALGATLPFFLR